MPVWMEWVLIDGEPLVWIVTGAAAVGAAVVWARQKRGKQKRPPVLVGWGAAVAMAVLMGAAAIGGQSVGLWELVWRLIEQRPGLLGWWLALAGAAMVAWGFFVHAWRGEARLARQCRACRYDLSAVKDVMVCPECGRLAKSERELRPVVVRRWAVIVGVLVIGLGAAAPTLIAVRREGWAKSMPDWALEAWVTRVDGLPESLRTELGERMMRLDVDAYSDWMGRFSRSARPLVARALNAGPQDRRFYIGLLQGKRLEGGALTDAIEGLRSEDQSRRATAAIILAETGPATVPFELLWPVLEGKDPEAAEKVRWLVAWQSGSLLREIGGDGTRPGTVRDAVTIKRVLVALTDVGTLDEDWELLRGLAEHYDPEVAARAAVLMAAIAGRSGPVPPNVLRRSVLGQRFIEALPERGDLPAHARTGAMLTWGRGPEVVALLADPDPVVRLAVCRQLTPVGIVPANAPWSEGVRPWGAVLPALQDRLAVETDAQVRAELESLIGTIRNGPARP